MGRDSRRALAALLALAVCVGAGAQSVTQLTCQASSLGAGIVQQCTGSGTLSVGQQDTYTWTLPAQAVATAYEGFDVDLEAALSSVTGDVDLQVTLPSGAAFTSARKAGEDIVFINRNELASGDYTFVVKGVAQTSNYILTVYITQERELNPIEQVVVGQVLVTCCNQSPGACQALKAAYPTLLDQDNYTNPNYCYMHGNVCSRDGRLLELSMPGKGMACPLPAAALASLSKLQRIDLSNNSITGNISAIASTLGTGPSLEFLDLSGNGLSGNLSAACGLARSGFMQQLALARNSLTGGLPACLTALKNLVELRLDGNSLAGPVPAFANAKSSKLVYFTAANQTGPGSGLNGSLPSSLRDLSRLAYLDLSGNALTGDLPVLPLSIQSVQLSRNALTNDDYAEAIPASYGTLSLLSTLSVRNNSLSGFLPAGIANLPQLQTLDASQNVLSGTLPCEWLALSALSVLNLSQNALTGTVPSALGDLAHLRVLDLSSNQLSGTLDSLANEASNGGGVLRILKLAGNQLSGFMDDLSGLLDFGIFYSPADDGGSPPANLTLDLSANAFSGAFPTWLFTALHTAPANVSVNLTGNVLTCPATNWVVKKPIPAGRLDGLSCQSTSNAGGIQQVPLSQLVTVTDPGIDNDELSGGAIFGIILAVLVAVGASGYIAWYWYRKTQQQKAAAAAAFSSGFGSGSSSYPLQSRPPSAQDFSAFSDDKAWSEPRGAAEGGRGAPPAAAAKPKHVGLASLPLSQKGEF